MKTRFKEFTIYPLPSEQYKAIYNILIDLGYTDESYMYHKNGDILQADHFGKFRTYQYISGVATYTADEFIAKYGQNHQPPLTNDEIKAVRELIHNYKTPTRKL